MELIDLTGKQFGRLAVLQRSKNIIYSSGRSATAWICECDCGRKTIVTTANLRSGHTTSCGCTKVRHGHARKERLYNIWVGMRQRCRDKNAHGYENYGGRGITICPEWDDYAVFREWAMSAGYQDDLTIDRIDVDGNYCPENCRWATAEEQANNMTKNRMITYRGETMSMSRWAERLGISYGTMNHRIQRGWSMERIESTPERRNGRASQTVSARVS